VALFRFSEQRRYCFAMKKKTAPKKAPVTDENRREAARLKEIWDLEPRDSQAVFGEKYKIGGQSAVGQFLRGDVALSLKAALGFERGLGHPIAEFSPRLARIATGDPVVTLTFAHATKRKARAAWPFRSISLEKLSRLEPRIQLKLGDALLMAAKIMDIDIMSETPAQESGGSE